MSKTPPENASNEAAPPASDGAADAAPREAAPVGKGSHVYLIDGSGYIFRAFHALPPLSRPSDGLPVGAVHGFCQMIWKLLNDTKGADAPTHLAVILDHSAKTFRNDIYPQYKAQRPPAPEELVPQFPLIRDAVRAFNVACVEQEGYEADDLIATYASDAATAGAKVSIVSSDKDLMQLVGNGIELVDTMKNRNIGPDEVFEKFGVRPDKVIDVQALAGDSVDNIPGVPGIGIKTAAQLIAEYGDLDTLLARAGEIKQPKRREKLIEFADQARVSRELVTLKRDVPVMVPLDDMAVSDVHDGMLLRFLRLMEFNTLTKRVADKLGIEAPAPLPASVGSSLAKSAQPVAGGGNAGAARPNDVANSTPLALFARRVAELAKRPVDRSAYQTVTEIGELQDWVARARELGALAFDTETDSLDAMQANLVGVSLALAPGQACYVPLGHRHASGGFDLDGVGDIKQIPLRAALDVLKPLLEDEATLKIGQNLKYDGLLLRRYGIAIAPVDDTMLLSYVLDAGKGGHGMDELSLRWLGHQPISFKEVAGSGKAMLTFDRVPIAKASEYAAEDADVTFRLWWLLKARLVPERMVSVYETLERPLVPVLIEMENAGIKVDRQILARLSSEFAQKIARLESEIHEGAGAKFNVASPKQLGEILFDKMLLPGGKRTKSGQWETRASLLDDLAANEDLPDDARKFVSTMLEWRQLSKLKSTYTDALPTFIHPETGRIHTSYAMAATTTGRLASTDPNLQNIPVRSAEGRQIRTAFIAEKGCKLISADYSQIELRVLAHIADIAQLKKAFAEGIDIHAMTASEMFGVPVENMPGDVRRRAKAINFGIIYGISAFGLAAQLSISRQEAGDYIATYFKRFPGIKDYMEAMKREVHANGHVTTLFGRRINYPEANTKNPSMRAFLERAAINAPIQGTAADIIRRAMIRMPGALADAGLAARMLLQVHDELIFETPESEVEKTLALVRDVMVKAPEPAQILSVPLQVDAKAADNWEAAH